MRVNTRGSTTTTLRTVTRTTHCQSRGIDRSNVVAILVGNVNGHGNAVLYQNGRSFVAYQTRLMEKLSDKKTQLAGS